MPIFEYLCKDCGREFEKIVPRYDSPADCIHCNSENVEKQLSVFAVAGGSKDDFSATSDAGCGRCGAPQPGMCGLPD
jgi:putative FmdB family regulatory protein